MNAIINRPAAPTEEIRFAFGTFSLGTVLVAASAKGIVAILMGDDRQRLNRELSDAFPSAHLTCAATGLEDLVKKVVTLLEAPREGLDLALDIRGSALEQATWQALRDVPVGRTITYGEIAKSLPLAATAQEVGAACAANVLAVAIPCHRVVKADRSVSGYRWGVKRKLRLINREAAA